MTISLSDIFAGFGVLLAAFSLWISYQINRKLANDRALKDWFIGDVNEIRMEYKTFLNKFISGQCSSKFIVTWFKVMQIRIDSVNEVLQNEYKELSFDKVAQFHAELKYYVTGLPDFDQHYNDPAVILRDISKQSIIEKYSSLHKNILYLVSNINKV